MKAMHDPLEKQAEDTITFSFHDPFSIRCRFNSENLGLFLCSSCSTDEVLRSIIHMKEKRLKLKSALMINCQLCVTHAH